MTPYPESDYAASITPLPRCAPREHWQEWFSWAFINAIASASGLVPMPQPIDVNQVDLTVQTFGAYEGRVRVLGLQLKSTYSPKFVDDGAYVAHDLEGDRYNKLLQPSDIKRFLVIVAVPKPPTAVVSLDSDVARLEAAAWWGVVTGESTTQTKKRVKLPTSQRFDVAGLKTMLTMP